MAINFQDAERRALERRTVGPALLTGSRRIPEDTETLSLVQQAGDVLAAPFRGIEGAAQDLYGLADALAFDALPDYEERVLGVSRTAVGGLVEGLVNFGVGFVGAEFLLPAKAFAKVGRLAPIVRGAAKGAVADFAVFDGNEQRLSDLLQAFPVLQNPVTEFLASDPEDPELVGRLKNVLEGLGVGAAVDSVALGLKALGIGRKARAANPAITPDALDALIDRAIPPDEFAAALRKLQQQEAGQGIPGQIGSPAIPEAAQAPLEPVAPRPEPPPAAATEDAGVGMLATLGVDEKKARELYAVVRRREAPISQTLQGLPPLNPRVSPSKLTPLERMEQELKLTDLNLERYRGPEGALQLIRGMAQVFEPLAERGAKESRTLAQMEATALKQVTEITQQDPHAYLVQLQQRRASIAEVRANIVSDKMALQSAAADAYRLMKTATAPTAGAKDMLAFLESLKFVHDVQLAVSGIAGEFGRGLGVNRLPTRYVADMFSLDEITAALHEQGGSARALDLAKKFKVLMDSEPDAAARTAKAADMARGLAGRRALGVLNSYWYNSLLGRPTTLVVAGLSTALTSIYRPLENILGGALTGRSDVMLDSVRELTGLVTSAGEAWRATVAAMRGEGQLLDPRSLISDVSDTSRSAFAPEKFGVAADSMRGQALRWIGRLVEYPSKALNASDAFFKQLNGRAVGRSQITRDVLAANPGWSRQQVAEAVEAKMGQLIYRGQAYGTAQLYHRGVEDAVRSGLTGKVSVDEHARAFVQQALQDPAHARLQQISDVAVERANEVAFTTPLTPGTLPYRYQEAVLNHPILRIITPFVRTPTNVLKFAFDRNVNALSGVAQLAADRTFGKLLPSLEGSRNKLVQDMLSGSARRRAEAMGRLAMGGATTVFILMKASETDEDGRPLITGFGPADRETRRLMEEDGWQQYSIKVGDRYVSYNRLDPFATILGIAADTMNTIRYAMDEDQSSVEDAGLGFAIAIAHNLTNKTYLAGMANAIDMLSDPQRKFERWAQTLAGSVVPGQAAAAVTVADPIMRDVQSMVDAMRARLPGVSDNLPPLRNILGEPVKRAQSLGSGWHPITNAFVPVLYREVSDDLVNKELGRLRHGFTPPKRVRGGLDLTTVQIGEGGQNAYDRWLELHGKVEIGGKTLRQSLRRLITSQAYSRIPAESTDELSSPRIQLIQGVIDDYRDRAYRQLVKEFPAIAAADRERFRQRTLLKRGVESRPELVQAFQPTQADAQQGTDAILRAFRPGS